jgi:dienelactone hydrolase
MIAMRRETNLLRTSLTAAVLSWGIIARAEPPSPRSFLEFIRAQAKARHADDRPPATLGDWRTRNDEVRRKLLAAWGGFPESPCPLDPKVLGTLDRDGYRVEKVIFQTRPGVWMTANAYVPDTPGKHPAILAVHGHWAGAKQDPVVQSRCIGAAKLGFFVLVGDAFGSGERAIGKALGEYHGEMTGATLLPVGLPLSGLQVYENGRAVDYLRTRPEVDGDRIGITGASGGGNQSMYAGAWDERLKAVVPVCSVGNYEAYLGIACCMCELVPGALAFCSEWEVLGLTAPRGLMVINATQDAIQFSVAESNKSLALVEPIYRLFDRADHVRHAIFDSKHDYNQPMREAMYGWMTRHLKGEGDGSPIAEPAIKTEDPETLRCYPGISRPDDWVTIPRFASAEGRKLLAARRSPEEAEAGRKALVEKVFGGFPADSPLTVSTEGTVLNFQPEPGIALSARYEPAKEKTAPLAILIDLEGAGKVVSSPLAAEIGRAGWGLVTLDLRDTGTLA